MVLVIGPGTSRRVPAGVCWIDRYPAASRVRSVRWNEAGIDYSAQLSDDDLRAYVMGCIIQYA
jgi:hypothetical protein